MRGAHRIPSAETSHHYLQLLNWADTRARGSRVARTVVCCIFDHQVYPASASKLNSGYETRSIHLEGDVAIFLVPREGI
jgi:hypothetical protein